MSRASAGTRVRVLAAMLTGLVAGRLAADEPKPSPPPSWVKAPLPVDAPAAAPGEAPAEPAGEAGAPGGAPAGTPAPAPTEPPAPASAEASEGDARIVARVDPQARVGDVLAWEVVVDVPAGTAVAEPRLDAQAANPGSKAMEVREPFAATREETSKGRTVRTFRARVTPFETGSVRVPGAEVLLRNSAGETRMKVPPVGTVVVSVLPPGPTPELKGAKDIVALKGPFSRALLGALAGVLATLLAVYLWKRRKVVLPARPAEPPIPFDERALRDLRELQAGPLLRERRVGEYYVRLSAIVRAYLGARYGFDALEMTTDELHRALRREHAAGNVRDLVRAVTDAADLVKFARHEPEASFHAEALAAAVRIVEVSRPTAGERERRPGPAAPGATSGGISVAGSAP